MLSSGGAVCDTCQQAGCIAQLQGSGCGRQALQQVCCMQSCRTLQLSRHHNAQMAQASQLSYVAREMDG